MTADAFEYDVFISFSSHDQEVVRPVWQALSLSGLRVFWSDVTLKHQLGDNWFRTIETSLERSRHMLVVFSDHALSSEWVRREYEAFLNHCYQPRLRQLIPLLAPGFKPNRLPLFLKTFEAASLSDVGAVNRIIAHLGGVDVERLKAENVSLASEADLLRRENSELKHQLEEARVRANMAAAPPKLSPDKSGPSAAAPLSKTDRFSPASPSPKPRLPSMSEACRILGVTDDAHSSVILRRFHFLKSACEALSENASQRLAETCSQRLAEVRLATRKAYRKRQEEERLQRTSARELLDLPASASSAEMWKKHDQFKKACQRAATSFDPVVRKKAEEELAELKKAAKVISMMEALELDAKPGEDVSWVIEGGGFVEGEVDKWLKRNGATVLEGEQLFQLKTAEGFIAFHSPKAGMLRIIVPAGEKVAPGTVIGRVVDAEAEAEAAVQE